MDEQQPDDIPRIEEVVNEAGFVGDYVPEEAGVPSRAYLTELARRHQAANAELPTLIFHPRTLLQVLMQFEDVVETGREVEDANLGTGLFLPGIGTLYHDTGAEEGAMEVVGDR